MKRNYKPFGEFLLWLGTILLVGAIALMFQLLISFVFLYKRYNWTFADMMKVTFVVGLVTAVFQPLFRRWKLKKLAEEETVWGDWHRQN